MADQVILKATSGPLAGTNYVFEEADNFLFGRASDCHARVTNDNRVSRHHFMVKITPPQALLQDLRSLNGVFVNGIFHGGRSTERDDPFEALLRDGDRIEAGSSVFEVEIPVMCVDCGQPMSETLIKGAIPLGDRLICPMCHVRSKAPTIKLGDISHLLSDDVPSDGSPRKLNCARCESHFVPNTRQGQIAFCDECTVYFEDDPIVFTAAMSPGICEYFIREKIAEGGQAVVFLCRKRSGGPPVAIKVLQTEKAVQRRKQQRFMREIDVMAKLDHPNVVRLIEFGSHEKIFFFIMEHMAGGSIMDLFKERGPLPLEQVMTMMRQTLEGLDYIHREGYIHRDIKPQNLLLTKKDNGLVKIADMGVAKNIQQSGLIDLTQTGTTMGSIFHMAREQLTDFKNVTSAADVWGVASTFYRMLTGQHVYDFSVKRQPITAVLEGAIVPIGHRNPQLPAALCDLFDRALAIDTDTRYKDAAEFLGALEQLPS